MGRGKWVRKEIGGRKETRSIVVKKTDQSIFIFFNGFIDCMCVCVAGRKPASCGMWPWLPVKCNALFIIPK